MHRAYIGNGKKLFYSATKTLDRGAPFLSAGGRNTLVEQLNTCATLTGVGGIPSNNGGRLEESEGNKSSFVGFYCHRIIIDKL